MNRDVPALRLRKFLRRAIVISVLLSIAAFGLLFVLIPEIRVYQSLLITIMAAFPVLLLLCRTIAYLWFNMTIPWRKTGN